MASPTAHEPREPHKKGSSSMSSRLPFHRNSATHGNDLDVKEDCAVVGIVLGRDTVIAADAAWELQVKLVAKQQLVAKLRKPLTAFRNSVVL